MSILDFIKIVGEVIAPWGTAFLTITGGILAIIGFNAWKKEFIGKRRIELAEEVLMLFYEARDAIKYIRKIDGEEDDETAVLWYEHFKGGRKIKDSIAQIILDKYHEKEAIFRKLNTIRHRFLLDAPKEAEKYFIDINNIVDDLLFAAYNYDLCVKEFKQNRTEEEKNILCSKISLHANVLWDIDIDRNEFSKRIANTIIGFEKIYKQMI